jgi:hypothetical protein
VPKCSLTYFSWDSIDGGFARQALEDLTGGNASTLDLAKKDKQVYGTSPTKFQAMVDDPLVLLSCSVGWNVKTSGGVGRSGEQGTINGLFKGHAYSVVGMHTCRDGQAFVHVRNPQLFFFVVRWVDCSIFFDIENIVHLRECKNE